MDQNHHLPNIPPEIISNILSRLPIKPLCRFKSVSKPWLYAIDNFVKTRLEKNSQKLIIASNTYPCSFYTLDPRSPNDFEEIKGFSECWFEILGSCKGVLLLRSSFCTIFLWNPFTRERRLITSPGSSRYTVLQGLGYDSARDDIKVVMVIKHTGDANPTRAYVFSSVTSYWKRIDNFGYDKYSSAPGVIINGSPHWIVSRFGSSNVIVYFDPYQEKFEELPIPVISSKLRLTVLRGDLCGVNDNNGDNSVDVWVMNGSSWSKMFVMPRGQGEFSACMFTPLCFVEEEDDELDGEFVVVQLNYRALALYNLKENKFERIELPRDCDRFSAACYVETLVSP